MVVDYVPTNNLSSQCENDGGGISYLEHDDDKTTDDVSRNTGRTGWGGGGSSARGGRGGRSGGRHTSEASSHNSQALPNDSEVSEPYFVFVVYAMRYGELFISKKRPAALPETWLLIDSCSTVDIISFPGLLDTIPTKNGRELVEKWVSELMTNF